MLNPRHIDAIAAVVRTGSTIAAAKALNTSQPSISRMIAALSSETGITLFEKSAQRLKITQEGQLFYEEVTRFFDGLERLENRVGEIRTLAKSELRIASILATSMEVVPKALATLQETHADLKTTSSIRSHARVLDMIAIGRADVGICNQVILPEGVILSRFWELTCAVVLHPDNPLAEKSVIDVDDLASSTFTSLGEYFNSTYTNSPSVAEGLNTAGTATTNLSLPAVWQIQANKGAAVIDPITASYATKLGLIVRPLSENVTYPISLIRTVAVPSPSAASLLTGLIVAEIDSLAKDEFQI